MHLQYVQNGGEGLFRRMHNVFKEIERERIGVRDRQTLRQTDGQTDRQKQAERQADRQTDWGRRQGYKCVDAPRNNIYKRSNGKLCACCQNSDDSFHA